MNFIKKIKKFFSEDTGNTVEKDDEQIEIVNEVSIGKECFYCKRDIFGSQKKKSFNGEKFHIQCYRRMVKEVKKDMGA